MDKSLADRVREVFDYDPESGILTRLKSTGNRSRLGPCLSKAAIGYYVARLDGVLYYVHRLIWIHQTGECPEQIDHKDGDRTNNKFKNLRQCTDAQNKQNMKPLFSSNTSGFNGVWWNKQAGKWQVDIKLDGKKKYFGRFDSVECAGQVALAAKRALHPFNERA